MNLSYEKFYKLDPDRTQGMQESVFYGLKKAENMVDNLTSFWHCTPDETAEVLRKLDYRRGYRPKFARFSILEAGLKAKVPYCASKVCGEKFGELLPTGAHCILLSKEEPVYLPWRGDFLGPKQPEGFLDKDFVG